MMQIHNLALSLKEAVAYADLGLNAPIEFGSRATLEAPKPFALLDVTEIDREFNSSGVALVTYEVTITVYARELVETVGSVLATFHRYWDRLLSLDGLTEDAELVLIFPGDTEIADATEEDLGQNVIVGVTSWTLKLSEHQPELSGV